MTIYLLFSRIDVAQDLCALSKAGSIGASGILSNKEEYMLSQFADQDAESYLEAGCIL